jgi:hypothetical protein
MGLYLPKTNSDSQKIFVQDADKQSGKETDLSLFLPSHYLSSSQRAVAANSLK